MSVGREQKQQRSRRFHRQTEIGTAPGTIVVNPEAPAPTIDVTRYIDRSLRTERLRFLGKRAVMAKCFGATTRGGIGSVQAAQPQWIQSTTPALQYAGVAA